MAAVEGWGEVEEEVGVDGEEEKVTVKILCAAAKEMEDIRYSRWEEIDDIVGGITEMS